MESSQLIENPVRNPPWLKWVTAFLFLVTVGNVSAMFIPAFSGNLPHVSLLIGVYLFSGLLFMSIWLLREKDKSTGFIVGFLFSLIITYSVEFVAAYYKEVKKIEVEAAVEEVNKALPKMLDEETRIDMISIDTSLYNYYFYMTVINQLLSEIDVGYMDKRYKEVMIPLECSKNELQYFLLEGYSFNYVYKDKSGKPVRTYVLKSDDCA